MAKPIHQILKRELHNLIGSGHSLLQRPLLGKLRRRRHVAVDRRQQALALLGRLRRAPSYSSHHVLHECRLQVLPLVLVHERRPLLQRLAISTQRLVLRSARIRQERVLVKRNTRIIQFIRLRGPLRA